ncbi:type I polyketide synthase [Actinomadura algeriensis]|uniref:Phthiocerol/phenolphthiocerol synthesis type-I polyketide synthase A n=1 Tax=Actinomadura algeriensis TaxID=1679523 RepID=A0ABR9JJ17_9ACTN|nr:type I polyketide synthase [Actinomadura algeriensis]MBE1530418.1 phthiocerol/phenolphthiocerol synthesis type-I polyketide synthase A [Actinomadura algeriensis]
MTPPGSPTPTEAEIRRRLTERLARRLRRPPDAVDPARPFGELGLRSRDIVEITGELQEWLDVIVDPALVYAHPTIAGLARACVPGRDDRAPETAAVTGTGPSGGPVAVIGIGCRFPGGVTGPAAFWDMLAAGRDGVGEVPADRWRDWTRREPAVVRLLGGTVPRGGFLAGDVGEFDAEHFGVSPREAAAMDPQQRMALEVAVEALRHAAIAPGALAGTGTGVFIGASTSDYGQLLFRDLTAVNAWTGTGASPSIIANRISYWLGVHGPSLVVDTACSSSLTAVHLAARSLASGESELALAGGVNLILSPGVTVNFHRAGAMAADGRCKTFDAAADGYVRGEGCGVLVLKRLADARRDGDRVLAVLLGSAVNSDGPSNGLMAPNPQAQEAVLRSACAAAGVAPGEVDYVEAHGTGTMLGDTVEARALGRVFGAERAVDAPLPVGSVKTNIGHLEAAAGVAGLIKVVLALANGRVPPSLHFTTPNPHIDFRGSRLRVVTRESGPPARDALVRPLRAGVSSFGFGGGNAHAILERAPADEPVADAPSAGASGGPGVYCLPVTVPEATRAFAAALADRLDAPDAAPALPDVGRTLARRTAGPCTAIVAGSRRELVTGLRDLAAGRPGPGVFAPVRAAAGEGPVWVFPGQGGQWTGMGRGLLAGEPAFAAAVDELDPLFVREARFSLRRVLERGRPLVGIDRVQPVLFGVQVALAALWRARGAAPAAVIGHSMGEVAAAVVAGALSPADGVAVIVRRSRLMARAAGRGAMALVDLTGLGAEGLAAEFPGVEVAGHLAPGQSTVAGDAADVARLVARLEGEGRLARTVRVDVASHSAHMDPLLRELAEELDGVSGTGERTCEFLTTVLDDPREAPGFTAAYWAANLRRPVRFEQAVRAASAMGPFVEVSPHPVLTHAIEETLRTEGVAEPVAIGTLRRDRDEPWAFAAALARLAAAGFRPAPPALHPAGRVIDLPAVPWRRTRHWLAEAPPGPGLPEPAPGTLLGAADTVPAEPAIRTWRALYSPDAPPFPGEHTVAGAAVVPAAVLLNTLLRASGTGAVADVRLLRPVLAARPLETQVTEQGGALRLAARPQGRPDAVWAEHLTARTDGTGPAAFPSGHAPDGERLAGPAADAMADGSAAGRVYPWRVTEAWRSPGRLRAVVELAGGTAGLLDAVLHLAPLAVLDDLHGTPVPSGAGHLSGAAEPDGRAVIDVFRSAGAGRAEPVLDVVVTGPDGATVLTARRLAYAYLDRDPDTTPVRDVANPRRLTFAPRWEPAGPATAVPPASVAVVGPPGPFADRLAAALRGRCGRVHRGASADGLPDVETIVLAPPAGDPAASPYENAVATVGRASAAIAAARGSARVWLTTRRARSPRDAADVGQTLLWGLAGVAAAEHPDRWGGVVDFDDEEDATFAALPEVLGRRRDGPLSIGAGTVTGLRLVPVGAAPGDPPDGPPMRCRPDAAYLVTGGLGALGLRTARWLAERGARRLVLAGRTPPPPRGEWERAAADPATAARTAAIRELEARGVAVQAVALDVGDAGALRRLVRERDMAGLPPVRGVVHAAGVVGDRPLHGLDDGVVEAVLWPKVAGLLALEAALPSADLDFLVLFSSAGALFGVPGQGPYAAANAFLDGFARWRAGDGARVASLGWGPWDGLGFAADARLVDARTRAAGLRPLHADEAFGALDHVLRHGTPQALVVAPGGVPDTPPDGLLADVLAETAAGTGTPADAEPPARRDWAALPPDELEPALTAAVRDAAATELGLPAGDLADDRPLAELGLDSIMGLALRRTLERLTGASLSATTLWNHPTVAALAALLAERLTGPSDAATPPLPADSPGDDPSWSALLDEVSAGGDG